jgi:hypothetical protein
MVKLGIKTYQPTLSNEIPFPTVPHGPDHQMVGIPYLAGRKVLAKDEDAPVRPAVLRTIIQLNNRLNPMRDSAQQWSSPNSGKKTIDAVFGRYFPKSRVDWKGVDPASDQALQWWAFSGFGALELRRLDDRAAREEQVGGNLPFFVSDYEFLKDLAVRPGLVSYGGSVYLDRKGEIIKIKLRGKDVLPGSGNAWEQAKFAYRSSSLVWATLYDHFFYAHYSVSNAGVLATISALPVDNPLRLLLKPFLFRTAAINVGGLDSLLPKGASFHRTSGFTWASMQTAFDLMMRRIAFKSLPDQLRERGIDQAALRELPEDIFPFGRDGELYWDSMNTFSSDLLENAPAFKGIVQNDAVKAWWENMAQAVRFSDQDLSRATLSTFLAQFFYTVSAYHSWVGHVTPYVEDPTVAAGKLFAESAMTDQQNSAELGVIASITGLPTPTLLGDFSHLMPDAYSRDSLSRMHHSLMAVNREIHTRNAGRDIPLQAFLPEEMNLSVAI